MPALDTEVFAQAFHIFHKILRLIMLKATQRCRAACATLIKDDDTVMVRVEEAAVRWGRACAGTPMKENDGNALGIAALFPIQVVNRIDCLKTAGIRLQGGE